MGRRPFAWLVLGLVFAFLVVSILLQAINQPVTSSSSSSAAASPAQGTSAASGNTQAGGGTPAAGGGPASTINATEKDFAIALDKSSVPAGTITFNIKNTGPSPHNLGVVAGDGASKEKGITGKTIKDSDNIDANKTGTITVDLQPGTYQVVCSIAGHVQLGMLIQLTVT